MHNSRDVQQKIGKPVITIWNGENNYQLVVRTILLLTSKRVTSGADLILHSTVKGWVVQARKVLYLITDDKKPPIGRIMRAILKI